MAEPGQKPPKDPAQPDGAKPGDSENLPNSNYAYDADAKAKRREEAPITIGGRQFFRVKKSWDVSKEMRNYLREQEQLQDKMERLDARKDAKTEKIRGVRDIDTGGWQTYPLDDDDAIETIETEVAAIDQQITELAEKSDQAAFNMIRLLLRDPAPADDQEAKPADAFLKEHLDASEAGELVNLLTSGREPDPTPATPSS